MVDFLKTLTDKFLDFFNIGRAISILIPGTLVAVVLLMLLSLAVFPCGGVSLTVSTKKEVAAVELAVPVSAVAKSESKVVNAQVAVKSPEPLCPLSAQIAGDFLRVMKHYWVVLMMALVIGILLFEVGNVVITGWSAKSGTGLYRFKEGLDADGRKLVVDYDNKEAEVGFIYFAPFLKAEFTGKENYYSFLITEYYRFLEFSAVMPLAMLKASFLAGLYYLAACHVTETCCHTGVVIAAVLLVLFAVILFYSLVFSRVLKCYRKASAELIKGVADATNKGIK